MKDFRAESIQVPSNWFVEMLNLEAALNNQTIAMKDSLGVEGAQRETLHESVELSGWDILMYFETCLSTPEVSSAIKKQVPYYYREFGEDSPDPAWGRIRGGFLRWWVLTRFKVNVETYSKMQTLYTICTADAFVEYFQSGSIKLAYNTIHEKMIRNNFRH